MADDIFIVDVLVTGSSTVTISDDGTGIDTIRINGLYTEVTQFTLAWSSDAFGPVAASAIYFTPNGTGFEGHRLVVNGVIENAVGTDGRDFIQGNVLGNLIFGDAMAIGAGLNDTLWGSSGNDTIHGGAGDDEILGDSDDDQLFGDAGADTISGGGGIDTIEGGAGADTMAGGASAGDTLSYAGSTAGIQIGLTFGTTSTGSGGDAAGDVVTGFVNVIGSAHDDRIEDTDKGTIAFGQNDNVFYGGGGRDRLILGGGGDAGHGGNGNDTLLGEVGDDALYGGNNDDHLRGGKGQDTLTGGNGADDFVFKTTNDSTVNVAQRDTITDFTTAEGDRIDLSQIDAAAGVPGDQGFHLVSRFTGELGELRVKIDGADVLVMGDINGDKQADFAILVQGVGSLTATDFAL